jgi:opacity protein-like surface antigen
MFKKSAVLLLALATPASAQDASWSYKATLYGWFPGFDSSVQTEYGDLNGSLSSSDVLSDLDMAFMGSFGAQNGPWGLTADLIYSDLSDSVPTPFGALFSEGTVSMRMTALSGYATYRVTETEDVQLDLGVGFRAFDMQLDATLTGAAAPTETRGGSETWIDPLIAARFVAPINDQWFVKGFADFGGTGSDDQTWQAYAGVGYKIDENWSAEAGWRYMSIKNTARDLPFDVDLNGAVFGVTYSF